MKTWFVYLLGIMTPYIAFFLHGFFSKLYKMRPCWFRGHDWKFVNSTGDWLDGGEYKYYCRGCGTVKISQRKKWQ